MLASVQYGPSLAYQFVVMDMGDPECGEDFCDGCGDCLDCQAHGFEEWCSAGESWWVVYDNDEKHPLKLAADDPRRAEYERLVTTKLGAASSGGPEAGSSSPEPALEPRT